MTYRDDLDALSARHVALENEVAHKTRERDEAARMLDEARTRASLPILDNIRVASPCSAPWSAMTGDARSRHCADCDQDVFDLSALTRDEAQALIVEKAGKLCVRYFRRADGTILTKDCAVGVKRKRRRRLVVAGAAVLLSSGGVLGWRMTRDCDDLDQPQMDRTEVRHTGFRQGLLSEEDSARVDRKEGDESAKPSPPDVISTPPAPIGMQLPDK